MALSFIIIGRRVKEIRLQKKITQSILAERVDMSVAYMSNIETAKRQVGFKTLVKIANSLGVTLDQLLNGNQTNDRIEYKPELAQLVEDCTCYEKRIIYEIALAAKMSIRNNKCLQHKGD